SSTDGGYVSTGGVTVLLGAGDGTFRAGAAIPTAGRPTALLSGDFNGDGRPDLAVAYGNFFSSPSGGSVRTGGVTVLLGRGDGTFRTGAAIPTAGRPYALLLGDFNGDGRPDLAVASGSYLSSPTGGLVRTGGVTVLLGTGDG